MSDLAKKLRELLSETEKEKMSGAGVILTLSELTVILAALEDAERLQRGLIIGFRNQDDSHEGRAWWSGGTWLEKGEEIVVIDQARGRG